jgi:hypothetical protein
VDGVLDDPSAVCQHSAVSIESAGRSTKWLGIARIAARCSTGWCVGPSSPRPMESWVMTKIDLIPIREASRMAGRA